MLNIEYELQTTPLRDRVWIHASDGSTVGRFGRGGVDLHNTITDQMAGLPECRLCTHGRPTAEDWKLFREKVLEWWGLDVPESAISQKLFEGPNYA